MTATNGVVKCPPSSINVNLVMHGVIGHSIMTSVSAAIGVNANTRASVTVAGLHTLRHHDARVDESI